MLHWLAFGEHREKTVWLPVPSVAFYIYLLLFIIFFARWSPLWCVVRMFRWQVSCDSVACCWDIVCGGGKEEKKKVWMISQEGWSTGRLLWALTLMQTTCKCWGKKTGLREKFWWFFFLFFSFFNCCQGTSVAVPVTFPSIGCQKWVKHVHHSALESICNNLSSRKRVNSHIYKLYRANVQIFLPEWLAGRQKLPDWLQHWTALEDSGDYANMNTICGLHWACVACPPGIGLRGPTPCWTSIHPSCQSCL